MIIVRSPLGLKSPDTRRAAIAVSVAASTLLITGCLGQSTRSAGQPAPEAPVASAPAPASDSASVAPDILYKLLVAEFAGRRGDAALAVDNYLDVARQTRDPRVAARAVRIAVFARAPDKGIEAARLWTEIDPASAEARQALAALLIRAARIDDAVVELQTLVDQPSERPAGFVRVVQILAREKNKLRAVEVMDRLARLHPGEPAAVFALGQLLTRAGELDRASAAFAEVLEREPGHEQAAVLRARLLRQQGHTTDALAQLSGFLAQSPGAKTARVTYARLLVDAKRYDEARAQFERLAGEDPEDSDVRYALALLLLQTNHLDEAETHFTRLADGNRRRHAARFYLGQIAEARKDVDRALSAYRGVDQGEHRLDARVRAAFLLAQQGDVDGARDYLRAATTRGPGEAVRIHRAEAEILVRNGRREDAMSVYDAAIEELPGNGDLLYARAMLAEKMDRLDILERDLRAILAREPDNADALNALGYTLADRTDRLDEALALIQRALELKPDDHYVVDSMGWVLYRMGRHDEALRHLRRAMELNEDPEVAAHLGEVLWVTGDREGARKVWNAALEVTPDHARLLEVLKRFSQ